MLTFQCANDPCPKAGSTTKDPLARRPRYLPGGPLLCREVTALQVCGDCLTNPSLDQRASAQNGRCQADIKRLAKAAQKRRAAKEARRANQTTEQMHPMQEPVEWDR